MKSSHKAAQGKKIERIPICLRNTTNVKGYLLLTTLLYALDSSAKT